jgi:hypothetical protein
MNLCGGRPAEVSVCTASVGRFPGPSQKLLLTIRALPALALALLLTPRGALRADSSADAPPCGDAFIMRALDSAVPTFLGWRQPSEVGRIVATAKALSAARRTEDAVIAPWAELHPADAAGDGRPEEHAVLSVSQAVDRSQRQARRRRDTAPWARGG